MKRPRTLPISSTTAAKDVQAQLDKKKGQEANDQAALQPRQGRSRQRRPADSESDRAGRQAAQKANEAAMNQPMDKGSQPDIAELQKQIAKQAADQKLPDAAKSADKAAKALEKGDIPNARREPTEGTRPAEAGPEQGMPMDKGMGSQWKRHGSARMRKGMGMQPGWEWAWRRRRVNLPSSNSRHRRDARLCSNRSKQTTPLSPPCNKPRQTPR